MNLSKEEKNELKSIGYILNNVDNHLLLKDINSWDILGKIKLYRNNLNEEIYKKYNIKREEVPFENNIIEKINELLEYSNILKKEINYVSKEKLYINLKEHVELNYSKGWGISYLFSDVSNFNEQNCDRIREYIEKRIQNSRQLMQVLKENSSIDDKKIIVLENAIKLLVKYTKDGTTYFEDRNGKFHDNPFKNRDARSIEKEIKSILKPFKGIFSSPSMKDKERLVSLRYNIGNELTRIEYIRLEAIKKVLSTLNSTYNEVNSNLNNILNSNEEIKNNKIKNEKFIDEEINKINNVFKDIINKAVILLEDFANRDINNGDLKCYIPIAVIENPIHKKFYDKDYVEYNNGELMQKAVNTLNSIESKHKVNTRKSFITISLAEAFTIFFEREDIDFINKIIKQMICEIPAGLLENILIDMKYLGNYYNDYNELREKNDIIVGKKVYTEKEEVNEIFDTLLNEILDITQNKLNNKYSNIYEYNIDNKNNQQPFKIVTILGFPNLFDSNMINKIIKLINNGPRCGINLFIQYEDDCQYEIKYQIMNSIKNGCLEFKYNEFCKLSKECMEISYNGGINKKIIEVAKNITDMKNKALSFDILVKDSLMIDPAKELSIPIGKNDKGMVQNITFGKGVSHHGLIAGQTGSGKSTLLHTIILSGVKNYTPDDLNIYLIDFKEGIEFKIYSKYRIPHIKLIGLESQVEFGESILEFMVNELKRRGTLFKENEVENLSSYKEKTGQSMPRILLIIDEFTSMFNRKEDREVTMNNAQLMKKIINQGRAFGINVLMASQTIKDTLDSTLTDEVIEQMSIRIGLKCTPKDAAALMGAANTSINTLGSERGQAIYNSENGRGENHKFKIAYINSEERDSILKNIESKYIGCYSDYECKVFDGNSSINIEKDKNSIFNSLKINTSKYIEKAWLGEPIKIGKPIEIRFEQGINNLCIISNDNQYSNRILTYFILSIVKQKRLSNKDDINKSVRFIDYNHDIFEDDNILANIIDGNNDIIQSSNIERPKYIIDELYDKFKFRRDNDIYRNEPIYLIINGMQRARDILIKSTGKVTTNNQPLANLACNIKENGKYDLRSSTNNKSEVLSTADKFRELLKDGGDYGVFIIVTCDSYKSYIRTSEKLGYRLNDLFNIRIAFNMNSKDGDRFIGTSNTETLNENTAIIYDDILGTRNKFIIYSQPTEGWIKENYIKGEMIYV